VIIVETCLTHLICDYICLYVVGVWIVVCEVWMKMIKYEFLLKNGLDDDFDVNWGCETMFVSVLIAFWCMLTNKQVWGTNLGQRGSKSGCTCLVQITRRAGASHGELLSATPLVLGISGTWGSIRTFINVSFDVFSCCHAFETYWNFKWIRLRLICESN